MKISIIVCARSSQFSAGLQKNVADTIGVDYEWVVVDNSRNEYTIFTAYNEGVKRAKGEVLCFMHDDILFHTQDWGRKVVAHLEDKSVGLIGAVGGHYFPNCPASWWSAECKSGQVIERVKRGGAYEKRASCWHNYRKKEQKTIEVVSVDGLFFCIPAYLFKDIAFDEVTYSGFHCYDADICMQIHRLGKKVEVAFDILIEHFSEGNMNYDFFLTKKVWYHKWKKDLPSVKGIELSQNDIEDRQKLVEVINEVTEQYHKALEIRKSKSYRLGKMLLKPFVFLKSIVK